MDDETREAFNQLRHVVNDQHERLLDQMTALARDFQNTKGFLPDDGHP